MSACNTPFSPNNASKLWADPPVGVANLANKLVLVDLDPQVGVATKTMTVPGQKFNAKFGVHFLGCDNTRWVQHI